MKNKLLIIAGLILVFSCKENRDKESLNVYFYNIYGKENIMRGYVKRVVYHKNDSIRIDSIYRYGNDKKLVSSNIDKLLITKSSIRSVFREDYFQSKIEDTCFVHTNDNNDEFKNCFIGKMNIKVNDIEFDDSSKYLIEQLGNHGLSKYKYFDKDFVLIREEFIEGYAPYYRIDRVRSIEGIR